MTIRSFLRVEVFYCVIAGEPEVAKNKKIGATFLGDGAFQHSLASSLVLGLSRRASANLE